MPSFGLGGQHPDSQGQSSSIGNDESRRFDSALFSALDALEESHASYAVIGGVAASGLGRPRSTQDIDIFVRPEDAEGILDILAQKGFRTEKVNPTWLFKAFKDRVLIDIIFRSQGGIYFDDEMRDRTVPSTYHGRPVRFVSPEDFVIIKCAVHSEEGPHHWHDALAVLSQAKVDWEYLLYRARKAPRRLLALLIYAQSNDLLVPNSIIQRLYRSTFHDLSTAPPAPSSAGHAPARAASAPVPAAACHLDDGSEKRNAYLSAQIREAIIQSGRTGSMDIEILVEGNKVLVRGQCPSDEHCKWLRETIAAMAPGYSIGDQLQSIDWEAPKEIEELA